MSANSSFHTTVSIYNHTWLQEVFLLIPAGVRTRKPIEMMWKLHFALVVSPLTNDCEL